VLKLLIMLEINLITVMHKKIGKVWYIKQSELNSCKWKYFSLKIFKGVPLHLNTYTCKYHTATYLMSFFGGHTA
jgi:hypothetical protein